MIVMYYKHGDDFTKVEVARILNTVIPHVCCLLGWYTLTKMPYWNSSSITKKPTIVTDRLWK